MTVQDLCREIFGVLSNLISIHATIFDCTVIVRAVQVLAEFNKDDINLYLFEKKVQKISFGKIKFSFLTSRLGKPPSLLPIALSKAKAASRLRSDRINEYQ